MSSTLLCAHWDFSVFWNHELWHKLTQNPIYQTNQSQGTLVRVPSGFLYFHPGGLGHPYAWRCPYVWKFCWRGMFVCLSDLESCSKGRRFGCSQWLGQLWNSSIRLAWVSQQAPRSPPVSLCLPSLPAYSIRDRALLFLNMGSGTPNHILIFVWQVVYELVKLCPQLLGLGSLANI